MTININNEGAEHGSVPEAAGRPAAGNLILVRHGETASNIAHILDTRLPGPALTELGRWQAQARAARLAVPAVLVASAALRAQETAAILGETTGVPVETMEGLHEVQVGDWEGRSDYDSHKAFEAVFHAWHAGDLAAGAPSGESGRDVLDRFLPVVTGLREKYLDQPASDAPGDVVIVSHGAAIRLAAASLTTVPGEFAANNHLDNTDTIVLQPLPGGGWQCLRWGQHTPPFTETSTQADDPMG